HGHQGYQQSCMLSPQNMDIKDTSQVNSFSELTKLMTDQNGELRKDMKGINEKLTGLIVRMDQTDCRVGSIEHKLQELETLMAKQKSATNRLERMEMQKIVMIYEWPEDQSPTVDADFIIRGEIGVSSATICDAIRLKISPKVKSKITPLKVTLKDRFDVHLVMKNKARLKEKHPKVTVTRGLIEEDRQIQKQLYEELKRHRAANPGKEAKFIAASVIVADGVKYTVNDGGDFNCRIANKDVVSPEIILNSNLVANRNSMDTVLSAEADQLLDTFAEEDLRANDPSIPKSDPESVFNDLTESFKLMAGKCDCLKQRIRNPGWSNKPC
ncbi:unnamed protein product, partial [Allacma fusca]